MANISVFRVPVQKFAVSYFKTFNPQKNGLPFVSMVKKQDFFTKSVTNYIRLRGEEYENYMPSQNETWIYLEVAGINSKIGLSEETARKLGKLIESYVRETIHLEVFFYQTLPGISVSEAILITVTKYDMGEIRIDSYRRFFDRFNQDKNLVMDRDTINRKINYLLKKVYDVKFIDYIDNIK